MRAQAGQHFGGCALTDEQRLHFDADEHRHRDEQHADADRAGRVPARFAGRNRDQHERERQRQAPQRREVFAEDDDQLALPRGAEPTPEAGSPTLLVDLAQRAPERERLGRDAEREDRDRHPRAAQRIVALQLVHAFVDREQAAHAEEHQRDDEAPEIDRPAVAERVVGRGAAFGLLQAPDQKCLIAAIGERMDRLGEHRGRAGVGSAGTLGQRDRDVGAERIDDRSKRIGS